MRSRDRLKWNEVVRLRFDHQCPLGPADLALAPVRGM
jgi:hypothetical protein